MKRTWRWEIGFDLAITINLYKQSLAEALTDEAERALQLSEIECAASVTVEGDKFVVTFTEL